MLVDAFARILLGGLIITVVFIAFLAGATVILYLSDRSERR